VEVVVKANTEFNFGERNYYTLESITLVPMQQKLIEVSMLTTVEMNWIDNYHKKCVEKVGPLLSGKALEWLQRESKPLKRS
jgi:Xaa-Pro aminopeptidase